jgi:hypothetical protein
MFSLGSLLFTESMQQVKESQSMDQQYFKKKIQRPLWQLFRKAFSLASSLAGLIYQFGADVTFNDRIC